MNKIRDDLLRIFFSDDIFISYSRADAVEYAINLAAKLKNFTSYLDQVGTDQGTELPESLLKKVRHSTVFVLLASEGANQSPSVATEISEFQCDIAKSYAFY
jgi:hypothetical protein